MATKKGFDTRECQRQMDQLEKQFRVWEERSLESEKENTYLHNVYTPCFTKNKHVNAENLGAESQIKMTKQIFQRQVNKRL